MPPTDERDDATPPIGAHADEGTMHEWLDGALDERAAAELAAHVAVCAECAARVAEARGLMAASSRILAALDEAPSLRSAAPTIAPTAASSTRRAPRGPSWRAYGSIAAVLCAMVTGVWVMRDVGTSARMVSSEAVAVRAAEPGEVAAGAVADAAAARAIAGSAVADDAVADDAVADDAVAKSAAENSDVAKRAVANDAIANDAVANRAEAENVDANRALADNARDVATSGARTAAERRAFAPSRDAAAMRAFVAGDDVLFAVRRFLCTDRCVLTRILVRPDGSTTIDGDADARRVSLADSTRQRLRALADSLDVRRVAWPFTGRTCGSVSALRSSLAVTVPGPDGPVTRQSIPWCPDPAHPIDRFAAALAEATGAAR